MNISGKRVLVTGASGFVGLHLVRRLIALGCGVAALCRTQRHRELLPSGVALYTADLCCYEDTFAALAHFQPEIIFHLASQPDAKETLPQAITSVHGNVGMTLHLLEAARLTGTRLMIYADSSKVYGNCAVPFASSHIPQPLCSYAIGKLASWELCRMYERLYDLEVVSIRSTLIYGPGQGHNLVRSVLDQLKTGNTRIELLGGLQTRDPLYIDDAVDAFLLAAEHSPLVNGEVINVGGGDEQTVHAIADQIVKASGLCVEVVVQAAELRRNEMLRSFCDNREAGERLGWKPRVCFAEGVQRVLAVDANPVLL